MESDKFDLVTRKISEIASRRSVIERMAGGGAVTALAGFSAFDEAEAKKKKKNKKKKNRNKKECKVNKCPQPGCAQELSE